MTGYLVLDSGPAFPGRLLGTAPGSIGEVVFNTSHSGYEQIASDPSYFQQIVVLTAPQQGNYGWQASALESAKCFIEGLVCVEMQHSPRDSSFADFLLQSGVPILTEISTRDLVVHLRDAGTVLGSIVTATSEAEARRLHADRKSQRATLPSDWPAQVCRQKVEDRSGNPKATIPRVAVIDFGCKENILRCLAARAKSVRVFPSRVSVEQILDWAPSGVVLSNGPGDPQLVEGSLATIQALLGRLPVFGICMGHQLLARSLGAKTYKLRFGHRGANHPVRDNLLDRVYMTSQNHGYAVDESSLPDRVQVSHRNLYDGTVQGLVDTDQKWLSVQFHPESHPGPQESEALFDYFCDWMR